MQGQTEVLKIFGEFTEITDNVKLIQMSVLMNTYKVPKRSKEEFQRLLKTVPVDKVREALRKKIIQDFWGAFRKYGAFMCFWKRLLLIFCLI